MTTAADWSRCRHWIVAALETCPTHTIEDIEAGIETGHFQFWAGDNCAAVTVIHPFPRMKAIQHWLSGGDLRELVRQAAHIETWAKSIGCTGIWGTSDDRAGLRRVMGRLGYRVGQIEFWKELT